MERFKNEVRNAADHSHVKTMFKAIAILEQIRSKYRHSRVIHEFYNNLIQSLPQNGDLLFIADETASTVSEKNLVPEGGFLFVSSRK